MAREAWNTLGHAGRDMLAQRNRIALGGRTDPTARMPEATGPRLASMKQLVIRLHRQHLARLKNTALELDELEFLAHYKTVKGWSKRDRVAKWKEIAAEPQRFRTSQRNGVLRVWVPQAREASIEEIVMADTTDQGRTLDMDRNQANQMLLGVGGGVTPSRNPTAILGGPVSIDGGFDSILTQNPLGASSAGRPHVVDGGDRAPVTPVAESPGPHSSVSQVGGSAVTEDSDSDESSESEEKSKVAPSAKSTTRSIAKSADTGSSKGSKRERDEDEASIADSSAPAGSKAGKRPKKEPTEPPLDFTNFEATITKPLPLSSMKIMVREHLKFHTDKFEVWLLNGSLII